jgi:hypothetical protein
LTVALGPDRRHLESEARDAASRGADAFRAYFKALPAEDRNYLKPNIGVYQDIATKADNAAKSEE